MDCSLSDSSVHGILQARIQEWVAIFYSRESSPPRDWTQVSHIAGGFITPWATKEVHSLAITPLTPFPSSSKQPLIYFLSLWISLLWNSFEENLMLCSLLWLASSLSVMLLRFIHVIAYISSLLPFYGWMIFCHMDMSLFVSVCLLINSWVVPTLWLLWIMLL